MYNIWIGLHVSKFWRKKEHYQSVISFTEDKESTMKVYSNTVWHCWRKKNQLKKKKNSYPVYAVLKKCSSEWLNKGSIKMKQHWAGNACTNVCQALGFELGGGGGVADIIWGGPYQGCEVPEWGEGLRVRVWEGGVQGQRKCCHFPVWNSCFRCNFEHQ